MVWLQFLISAAIVVFSATKLTEYGDTIAVRTKLGGMFVGTLLMAGATSLPELLATINSLQQNLPNLAIGNILGSSMFNMLLLAFVDLLAGQVRVLRQVAMRHAFTASMAVMLTLIALFSMITGIDVHIGWVSLDSLLIIAIYIITIRMLQSNASGAGAVATEEEMGQVPSLRRALIGFALACGALVVAMPWLVRTSAQIAEITGLTTGFIGTTLVSVTTSLPEITTLIVAVRLGAYDLAVGNLFGSNVFNIFALGLADVFYTQGRFLHSVDPAFAVIGLLGCILTCLGLIGNITPFRRRLYFIEIDSMIIVLIYIAGLWLLYSRGIGV